MHLSVITAEDPAAVIFAPCDVLTGLPNRASCISRVHRLIQEGTAFAVLGIDLDRFKAVNDRFGRPTGDAMLLQMGQRLRATVKSTDWIARVGGDEFVAILQGEDLRERARVVAEAIVARMSESFVTEAGTVDSSVSVGVTFYPEDGAATEQLRHNTEQALYRAKHKGGDRACFFNADMDAAARDRQKLEKDLRLALEVDAISLFYQPVIEVRSGQISSVEALARWIHPERGPIRPDIFIPLAEESGIIDALGRQLLRRACMDALVWPAHIRVAVNLSPLQFISGNLLETVRSALDDSGLAPNRLQLEVTEGLVIRDVEQTFAQLDQLRGLGIQILIDDFGVGYSSLSYFQRFPFDKVKIDKSFVKDVSTSRVARAIIQAVIGLGNELGMGVVAEGVETEEQMRMLKSLGCTHLQGYLFSKPLAAEALTQRLRAGSFES